MTTLNGWEKMPFGEIATLVKGVSYASEDYCGPGQGAIFLTIKCVSKAGGFKPEGIKYFKGEIADSQELHAGDLLIANTDLTRAGDIVGAPIIVPSLNGETITMSMDLSKVVEDDGKIDRQFLYFVLMTDRVRRFMKDHASGSTVLHLQTRAVPTLEIDIPNKKPEQTKIAEILSTVDQAIDQTEALIAKQQRIKTGLMQDLLTRGIDENGNLRPPPGAVPRLYKDSSLGWIPKEWEIKPLSGLAQIDRGKFTHRPRNDPQFYGGEFPFIQTGDVTSRTGRIVTSYTQSLNERGTTVSREFPAGTIAISIAANIADTAILGIPMYFPDSIVGAVVLSPNSPRFVEMMIRRWKPVLDRLAPQSAQKNINLETLRPLPIPTPSPNEQFGIGNLYEGVDSSQEQMEQHRQKLCSLKAGLMQDLLTGKVSVAPLLTKEEGGV